jgi:hypothetical protein
MVAAFRVKGREPYLPLLAWLGVATRWRDLLDWLETTRDATADLVRSSRRSPGTWGG